MPALAAAAGARITEIPVRHHPRRFGKSKYGLSRTYKVLVDLLTLEVVTTFRMRPLLAFAIGMIPTLALAVLFGIVWIVAFTQFGPNKAEALVLPGAALLWLSVSIYLLMLGLIGEVAVRADLDSEATTPSAEELL